MKSNRVAWLTCLCVSAVLVGLPFAGSTANADPIGPGFDYFITPPGGAGVDLSPFGGPAGVPLMGIPLPGMTLGTDTVVARMDPGPPEGGIGVVDIELVALHLRSVVPVDPDGAGGPAPLGDLHITIDASDRYWSGNTPRPNGTGTGPSFFDLPILPAPPSVGNMRIGHGGPGPHTGAAMAACLGNPGDPECAGTGGLGVPPGGIYATLTHVVPGGNPSNPMDVIFSMPAPRVALGSTGTYLHTPLNNIENGGVILGTILHVGPHPNTIPVPDNAVPEPTSALLELCTVLGCGVVGRRRHGG